MENSFKGERVLPSVLTDQQRLAGCMIMRLGLVADLEPYYFDKLNHGEAVEPIDTSSLDSLVLENPLYLDPIRNKITMPVVNAAEIMGLSSDELSQKLKDEGIVCEAADDNAPLVNLADIENLLVRRIQAINVTKPES